MGGWNRYQQAIERIFHRHFLPGLDEFEFGKEEVVSVAAQFGIILPKDIAGLVHSFRYSSALPQSIKELAAEGMGWVIQHTKPLLYSFRQSRADIVPTAFLSEIKLPDATPGVVARYGFDKQQALLAKLRYNRLLDIFTGSCCYWLGSHASSSVPEFGRVETDEIHIGLDRRGAQCVFPLQAKASALLIAEVERAQALCAAKFPKLVCRPIGAQLLPDDVIALFELELSENGVSIYEERHYRLVSPSRICNDDIVRYQQALQE